MYLWHGWWPQSDEDSDSRASTTGSAETRWSNDRRLAMETTKSYAEGSYSHSGVHNHVLVDVMGKQLPFLKISPCVISKYICSVQDPSLHCCFTLYSSKTREQEQWWDFCFCFFSAGNLINSEYQNDTKTTSCKEGVLSSTPQPVPSFSIVFLGVMRVTLNM